MDDRLRQLLGGQEGVIATWQLRRLGLSAGAARGFTGDLQQLHDGVHLTGFAAPTRRQLWWAAARSAPATALSGASAGASWGLRPWEGAFEVVTRTGSAGPRRFGALLVCRSRTLAGDVTTDGGMPITTPQRTIADLAVHLPAPEVDKAVREAVRLDLLTMVALQTYLAGVPGRRGTAELRRYVDRHVRLPFHRCRSDAEAMALEVFDAARDDIPDVNERIAGEEADLSWPDRRLIIESTAPPSIASARRTRARPRSGPRPAGESAAP